MVLNRSIGSTIKWNEKLEIKQVTEVPGRIFTILFLERKIGFSGVITLNDGSKGPYWIFEGFPCGQMARISIFYVGMNTSQEKSWGVVEDIIKKGKGKSNGSRL